MRMSEQRDAREGQLDQAEFKKKMLSQLQTTGLVGQVKSQLRAQLLSQLQKGQLVQLGPPPGDRPGLKRHALNSMIADYFGTVEYNYSLSVFKEESGVDTRPMLTEDELLDVLKVDRETSFYQSYMKSKAHGGQDSCFIVNILSAISEAAAARGKESFTQTVGSDRYQMEVRMMQLENEYQARLREARMAPGAGVEERMALYRQEVEEQAAAEVARQVERIREMEVAAARLDEASKARRALEAERLELDRLHSERLSKLRQREEEMTDKLRRQQRDVENIAYEYRQRILREEERLRNQKTEMQQQVDSRQEQLKQLERSLELREKAVTAREAAAEKKLAEATEAVAEAHVTARQEAEREYLELKSGLAQQRMQLEMDRSRVLELRSEATAEVAAARAKEDRLRALETARAEAEARAAAHAADAEVCRLQAEKLSLDLSQVREELSRRLAQAAEGADAMLQNAAGAMNMLNAEAMASRASGSQIREAVAQVERAREAAATASATVTELQQERAEMQLALSTAVAEAETLRTQLRRVEELLDEAVAARAAALTAAEESQFRIFQQERELGELRNSLGRAREEAAALRLQVAVRRPQSRGSDSPHRRSVALSPTRRSPRPGNAATISGLSLGIALGGAGGGHGAIAPGVGGEGGGPHGSGQMGHHLHSWQQHGPTGGPPGGASGLAFASMEFPVAPVPKDAVQERHEWLRRQEGILASQEEAYRKRATALQEVRSRGLAVLSGSGTGSPTALGHSGSGMMATAYAPPYTYGGPPQPPLPSVFQAIDGSYDGSPPYMTYVAHSRPSVRQFSPPPGDSEPLSHHHPVSQPYAVAAMSGSAAQQVQMYPGDFLAFPHHHQHQSHPQHEQQQQQQQISHMQRQEQVYQHQQQQQHGAQDPYPSYPSQPLRPHHQHQHGHGDQGQYPPYGNQQHPLQQQPGDPELQGRVPTSRGGSPDSPTTASGAGGGNTQSRPPSATTAGTQPLGRPNQPTPTVPYHQQQSSSNVPYISPDPRQQGPPGDDGVEPRPYQSPQGGGRYAASASSDDEVVTTFPPGMAPGEMTQPPPPFTLTSAFQKPEAIAIAGSGAMQAAVDLPPAPAPVSAPAAPPGLMIVKDFNKPAASGPPPQQLQQQLSEVQRAEVVAAPPPPEEIENMLQAKMRLLQEQRERALAAQQQQQQQHTSVSRSLQRSFSRSISSGPPSGAIGSLGSGGAPYGAPPGAEDSSSEVLATEAYDTVAPELSTTGGRRTTLLQMSSSIRRHSGEGGHVSRQSSVNKRAESIRGTSFARSEMLDDIPSSLEGYEVRGLHDDDEDEGVEAPDDDRVGTFAPEFSSGSVW